MSAEVRGVPREENASASASTGPALLPFFAVCWALAHWFHLMEDVDARVFFGNRPEPGHLMLSLAVGWVLLRPDHLERLVVLAVAGMWTVWNVAPGVSNHWLLAGFVNLAVVGAYLASRSGGGERRFIHLFVPAARWTLLAFYSLAALAKLNTGFLDPIVSCAPAFMERSFSSVGLPADVGASSPMARLAIIATIVIELAVPILLLLRRTRVWGVLLGIGFHSFLALDLEHHFSDFTSVLTALFLLFLPADFARDTLDHASRAWSAAVRRADIRPGLAGPLAAAFFGGFVVLAELLVIDRDITRLVAWSLWHLCALAALAAVIGYIRRGTASKQRDLALVRPAGFLVAVPLLALFNGMAPYLELKTSGGWNMYSNLRTSGGESNHLIIRRTFPITDQTSNPYRVVASDNPLLRWHADNDYGITPIRLRMALSRDPDASITYERDGTVVALDRAADEPALVEPVPLWLEKLQNYAPVDLGEVERCRW